MKLVFFESNQSHQSVCQRLLLSALLSIVLSIHRAEAIETAKTGEELAQNFKAFVEHPPIIESLVFSINMPLTTTNGVQYYHARWQTNGFFLREMPSLNFVDAPMTLASVPRFSTNANVPGSTNFAIPINMGFCVGFYENQAWFVDRQGNLAIFPENLVNKKPTSAVNLPLDCAYALNFFSQVIHMGIPDLEIGSVKWKGNEFESQSKMTQSRIKGSLEISNGIPRTLKFGLIPRPDKGKDKERRRDYTITYAYSTNTGLSYIPSDIIVKLGLLDRFTTYSTIKIFHVSVAQRPMDSIRLGASSLIRTNARVFVVKADGVFESKNGVLVKSFDNVYAARFDPAESQKLLYYTSVGLLTAISLFALLRRQIKSAETQKPFNRLRDIRRPL